MNQSNYVYFVEDVDKTIIFNGINERYFIVKPTTAPYYKNILSNPNYYFDTIPSVITKLIDEGFIVDDSDEVSLVHDKFTQLRKEDEYYLMVLPTYQCNLRCWYCVQEHQNLFMTDETVESVKKHISKVLKKDDIKTLLLSWFGGEPLLAYDKIVDITRFAQRIAKDAGKKFRCTITTNATLLTPSRIEELCSLGITNYQITIDGKKDVHDRYQH